MATSRKNREYKKKMGQFMTPESLAKEYISARNYKSDSLVLEPSFGTGNFLIAIIDRFIEIFNPTNISEFVQNILENNIHGVEMDTELYNSTIARISTLYNLDVTNINHNLLNSDFFDVFFTTRFDYIEGNPPFGGSMDESKGILLDKIYGKYNGVKIKKETYSFFTYKCYTILNNTGQIGFICSDTFMSIPTMKGIRCILLDNETTIQSINFFSHETNYPMVYFNLRKSSTASLTIDGCHIDISRIQLTDTLSFKINAACEKYFVNTERLSNYITCSSGMTIGKNELFLKEISNGMIVENLSYSFHMEPKTLQKEKDRSRLAKVSKQTLTAVSNGELEKILKIHKLDAPYYVSTGSASYKPYNKATPDRFFSCPSTYIFWENEGEAVITYKKTGPWYLHGVGGANFFNKEGLTWRLISNDIRCRYLPSGYILDSGSPVGVLKPNIDKDELYFIIGWLNTTIASQILKSVLNHTKNIQSKDIERMPYPSWVLPQDKHLIISLVKDTIDSKSNNHEQIVKTLDMHFRK